MHTTRLLCTAIALMSVCVVSVFTARRVQTVPLDRDEISWYFHTEFFDEAIIERNISSRKWDGYESYDHPQVSKYIYGAFLYAVDPGYAVARDNLREKYGRWNFYTVIPDDTRIGETEFASVIALMRTVNTVQFPFLAATLFLLFLAVSGNVPASFVWSLLLVRNPLFIDSVSVVTSDAHMLMFAIISVLLYFRSLNASTALFLVLAGGSAGLSVASKLNGVFIVMATIAFECIRAAVRSLPYRQFLGRIALYTISVTVIWCLVNPATYRNPISSTWTYFAFRNYQSANIAAHIPSNKLATVTSRLRAFACTVLLRKCGRHWAPGAVSRSNTVNAVCIVLVGIGAISAFVRRRREAMYVLLSAYVALSVYSVTLSNYGARYFLYILCLYYALAAYGSAVTLDCFRTIARWLRAKVTETPHRHRVRGIRLIKRLTKVLNR